MAALTNKISRIFSQIGFLPVKSFVQHRNVVTSCPRSTFFFRHLQNTNEHNKTDYKYEVTQDPNEWKYVEKLLPLVTVPVPEIKSKYPSGWTPMKEEALKGPYFVRRTKNHMLPVYFNKKPFSMMCYTKVKNIQGDLWSLHQQLLSHLEEIQQKKIPSFVHEGNNTITFRGDHVYYVEQWMLGKGF